MVRPSNNLPEMFIDPVDAAQSIGRGLSAAKFRQFQKYSMLSLETLSKAINLPLRTLHRRGSQGRLSPDESDRLYRLATVFHKAVDFFDGDVAAAKQWLSTPAPALGSKAPLDLINTYPGARAVESLIGQLEHGVFP